MLDLSLLTDKVRSLAIEAGSFIRDERKKFHREAVEKKHAHDYVSYVDKESEKRIVTCLKELLPEAGFIAEEGSGNLTDEEYCWLVDPLDGTTNFIHDNAPYCVSIALRSKKNYYWAWYMKSVAMNVSGLTKTLRRISMARKYMFHRYHDSMIPLSHLAFHMHRMPIAPWLYIW